MEKKYNFTYQTKNLINGKTYIGVHSTDKLNDGYIGCGVRGNKNNCVSHFQLAVRKHGYKNFKLEILSFFDTAQEAYEEEVFLVDERWVNSKDNYNKSLGGRVSRALYVTDETREKLRKANLGRKTEYKGDKHYLYGKKFPDATLKNRKENWDKIDWTKTKKYFSDIYVFNINTKSLIGTYKLQSEIFRDLGISISCVSRILKGIDLQAKQHFITYNKETWYEDYLERLKNKCYNYRGEVMSINVDTGEELVHKNKAEALKNLNLPKNCMGLISKACKSGGKSKGYYFKNVYG